MRLGGSVRPVGSVRPGGSMRPGGSVRPTYETSLDINLFAMFGDVLNEDS